MPASSERQRRFMGAELERKREGKKTRTGMSEAELEEFASKPTSRGTSKGKSKGMSSAKSTPRSRSDGS